MVSQDEQRLRELARRASVAIEGDLHGERAEFWGSGLLVAPEWVLTCAHVLVRRDSTGRRRWAGDRELGIRVGGRLVRGRAVYALPGPDAPARWEQDDEAEYSRTVPDLALIRLLDPVHQGCVWLSDRTVPPVSSQVTMVGWLGQDPWDGTCHVPGNDRIDVFRLGPDSEIPPGVSGSLVVDLAHGRVVGVVKARRKARDGGKAVLLTALRALAGSPPLVPALAFDGNDPYQELVRAHDRWHYQQHRTGADRTWIDIQGALPDVIGQWTPFDRVQALGLLAELPPPAGPGVVQRLVEQVLGPGTVREPLPRAWRDGHGLLYEPEDGRERYAFLSYLVRVAAEVRRQDPARAEQLRDWALDHSLELPTSDRAGLRELAESPAAQATVVVAFAPVVWADGRPERFRWEIQLVRGADDREVARVCDEEADREGITFEDAVEQIQEPLVLALDRADGAGLPAPVEIAVPVERFDTVAHGWTPGPPAAAGGRARRAVRAMGARRPVVVRNVERGGRMPPAEWRYRWEEMRRHAELRPLPLSVLDESPGYEKLRSAPWESVPVLCGPVGDGRGLDIMLDVLEAGHGLALWRTTAHPDGACDGSCLEFQHQADLLLARVEGAGALPESVRALRAGGDCSWAEGIMLLYDDALLPLPEFARPSYEAS
jgi:hypothetical protein